MAGVRENQPQTDMARPYVFGLDIGTRSIVGTVGYRKGERFCVVAQEIQEHASRAMLDGQIHDIGKVGETIRQVKRKLEENVGRPLSDVCIAAAGRVLRTVNTYVEIDFGTGKEITAEDIYSLDTMGVEKAYGEFSASPPMSGGVPADVPEEIPAEVSDGVPDGVSGGAPMKFYCVGYTPMRYYMNGYPIGNLRGHKARTIGVDLIATFLPDDVVDGLYKAVEAAGLQVVNLTLEPIAAMQVAIPEKYRMLNMALVDVGAGTSDISITKAGAITAYGMIPVAGDSLTDLIVQHCLVDFDTAEEIKRKTGVQEEIEYLDIMGLNQKISSQEILEILREAVRNMAKMAADCIRELNGGKAVSAVFVVGGGGVIPGYTESLAKELGIAKERVAIRGEEVMQMIEFEWKDARRDSLMVTPIGICLCYYEQGNSFIFVMLDAKGAVREQTAAPDGIWATSAGNSAPEGVRLKLYDNGRLVVADVAMQARFPNDSLFPKRGKALTFTVNGKSKMVRGQQGEAAAITINGETADINTKVHNGDHIKITPSTAGEDAKMNLGRLAEMAGGLTVMVNSRKILLPRAVEVNGEPESVFYFIQDGDEILVHNGYTVEQIARYMDVPLPEDGEILVNGFPARPDTKVYENFTIEWEIPEASSFRTIQGEGKRSPWEKTEKDREEDGEKVREGDTDGSRREDGEGGSGAGSRGGMGAGKRGRFQAGSEGGSGAGSREGFQAGSEGGNLALTVSVNGSPTRLSGKQSYVFVDIFEYYPFDLSSPNGRDIVISLNGRPAEYLEELKDGDVIDLYWRKHTDETV
ncbi:MAG: rod shape-determining protein [Clostridium sp.]|jgi:cell division ATPase FtsA|nr:rod shape-determining protein [Clostridium sp.]